MKVYSKEETKLMKKQLRERILQGVLFIYPTDTIYGIGCNALDEKAVKKLRKIKKIPTKPVSVIAPSRDWIYENCVVPKKAEEWIKKIPGPYTLILKLKNKKCVAPSINPEADTVGIRIPQHWTTLFFRPLDVPIVTTSANVTGSMFMTKIEDLDEEIEMHVDFAIYEGPIKGHASTIVNLSGNGVKVRER